METVNVPSILSAKDDPIIQWVTFMLENETYGINVMQVQEVLRYTDIAPVPGSPSHVLGIINLRGSVVTIIDTRKSFSLNPQELTQHSRIIIVEHDDKVCGLLVDSVQEVIYLRNSHIDLPPKVPNREQNKHIRGVWHHDDSIVILLTLDALLMSDANQQGMQ